MVVAVVISSIIFATWQADRKSLLNVVILLSVWMFFSSLPVVFGLTASNFIPVVPILFIFILTSAGFLGFGSFGSKILTLPLWTLAAFHSFRLPLEIVLHMWSETGTVPATMTWSGQNFDVITGVIASFCFFPVFRRKSYIWFVNISGTLLLINVLRVVVMSAPLPFSWNLEKPLLVIIELPYAWIATICVWAAIIGHIVLTRALITKNFNPVR